MTANDPVCAIRCQLPGTRWQQTPDPRRTPRATDQDDFKGGRSLPAFGAASISYKPASHSPYWRYRAPCL